MSTTLALKVFAGKLSDNHRGTKWSNSLILKPEGSYLVGVKTEKRLEIMHPT